MCLIGNDWDSVLGEEYKKPYFIRLMRQMEINYAHLQINPPRERLFLPFRLTPYASVKAVILGKEPYHEPGIADGLAYSARGNQPIPSVLRNIFTELQSDLGIPPPESGSLEKWAREGVLLWNRIATVREGVAGSDCNYGWEQFTDRVVAALAEKKEPVAFLLWGNFTRSCAAALQGTGHLVLTGFHPSPQSADRGFFGSKPFSKANEYLVSHGAQPIDWRI